MRTLAQSCPNIEELNLSQCKKISDATCAALSNHCPKLQRLNLDSCPEITDLALKDISDGCPHLTHINLSWCELLTDNGVEALARGCPELRSFLSKGCRQLTDRAIKCIARFCPNLEAINLHECRVKFSRFLIFTERQISSRFIIVVRLIFVAEHHGRRSERIKWKMSKAALRLSLELSKFDGSIAGHVSPALSSS